MAYRVYAATRATGVYYCSDFVLDDSTQPTWTRVNDGLPSLDIRQMEVDKLYPERYQYVLLEGSREVYRRVDGGAWTLVLQPADVPDGTIHWIACDEAYPGVIVAMSSRGGYYPPSIEGRGKIYLTYSADYGDGWLTIPAVKNLAFIYTPGNIIIREGLVYLSHAVQFGAQRRIWTYSFPLATISNPWNNGAGNGAPWCNWSGADIDGDVLAFGVDGASLAAFILEDDLSMVAVAGSTGQGPGMFWLSRTDPDHHRVGGASRIDYTDDRWATSNMTALSPGGLYIMRLVSPPDNDTPILIGRGNASDSPVVYYIPDETTADVVNKSGTNWNTAPYTNSIPKASVSGAMAQMGMFILPPTKELRVHAVEGVPVFGVEIPKWGDRAVVDSLNYPVRHSNEIGLESYHYHVPIGIALGNMLVWDGSSWVLGSGVVPPIAGETEIEAGEDLAAGDVIDIYDDGGAKVRKADSLSNYPADGFVLAAVSAGGIATVYLGGILSGLSGLTPGAKVYLSTAGAVSETSPTAEHYIVQEVGIALNATSIKFEPQQTILLAQGV